MPWIETERKEYLYKFLRALGHCFSFKCCIVMGASDLVISCSFCALFESLACLLKIPADNTLVPDWSPITFHNSHWTFMKERASYPCRSLDGLGAAISPFIHSFCTSHLTTWFLLLNHASSALSTATAVCLWDEHCSWADGVTRQSRYA